MIRAKIENLDKEKSKFSYQIVPICADQIRDTEIEPNVSFSLFLVSNRFQLFLFFSVFSRFHSQKVSGKKSKKKIRKKNFQKLSIPGLYPSNFGFSSSLRGLNSAFKFIFSLSTFRRADCHFFRRLVSNENYAFG